MELFAPIFGKITARYVELTDDESAMILDSDMGERASFIIAQTVCIDVILYQHGKAKLCVAHIYMNEQEVYNLNCGRELGGVSTRAFHVDDFAQFVRFIAELMVEFHDNEV